MATKRSPADKLRRALAGIPFVNQESRDLAMTYYENLPFDELIKRDLYARYENLLAAKPTNPSPASAPSEHFCSAELSPIHAFWVRVWDVAGKLDPRAEDLDANTRKTNPRHKHEFLRASKKEIFITSEQRPLQGIRAGRVFSAVPVEAAKHIQNGTHRLSTSEEIAGWRAEQEQRKRQAAGLTGLPVHISADCFSTAPVAPIAPEGLSIADQIALNWQIIQGWFRHLWKHPRLAELRLRFYRPNPDNDDWLSDPLKREKVAQRVYELIYGTPPSRWTDAVEHWEYLGAGAVFGVLFYFVIYLVSK